MKKSYKLLVIASFLLTICICAIFGANTNRISGLISILNNTHNQIQNVQMPSKQISNNKITPVNTAAIGRKKLNMSTTQDENYKSILPESLIGAANYILNNEGRILFICNNNNANTENIVACLQFLAGDDYDNVKNFYLKNFTEELKNAATTYFNQSLARELNINIKDVPYLNLKKNVAEYLYKNNFSKNDVDSLIAKLKENFD